MMDSQTQFWFLTGIFSILINLIFILVLFFCQQLIKKMFWNIRTYFAKNNGGYGYAMIMFPEGRLEPIFVKLETKITIQIGEIHHSYLQDKKMVFSFWGLPSYIYNLNDNKPVDIREKDESHDITRHSEMLDNLCVNIKALAEANAFKKFAAMFTFIIFCLIGIAIVVVVCGYSAVKLTDLTDAFTIHANTIIAQVVK